MPTTCGTSHPNLIEIIQECCGYRAPAIILNVESALFYCHSRLTSVNSKSVTLELMDQLPVLPIGCRCCVSFNHRGKSQAFFLRFWNSVPPNYQPSFL